MHVSLILLYAYGGWLVQQGLISLGTLLAAIGFTFSLLYSAQGLLQSWISLRGAAASVGRVGGQGRGRARGVCARVDDEIWEGVEGGFWEEELLLLVFGVEGRWNSGGNRCLAQQRETDT